MSPSPPRLAPAAASRVKSQSLAPPWVPAGLGTSPHKGGSQGLVKNRPRSSTLQIKRIVDASSPDVRNGHQVSEVFDVGPTVDQTLPTRIRNAVAAASVARKSFFEKHILGIEEGDSAAAQCEKDADAQAEDDERHGSMRNEVSCLVGNLEATAEMLSAATLALSAEKTLTARLQGLFEVASKRSASLTEARSRGWSGGLDALSPSRRTHKTMPLVVSSPEISEIGEGCVAGRSEREECSERKECSVASAAPPSNKHPKAFMTEGGGGSGARHSDKEHEGAHKKHEGADVGTQCSSASPHDVHLTNGGTQCSSQGEMDIELDTRRGVLPCLVKVAIETSYTQTVDFDKAASRVQRAFLKSKYSRDARKAIKAAREEDRGRSSRLASVQLMVANVQALVKESEEAWEDAKGALSSWAKLDRPPSVPLVKPPLEKRQRSNREPIPSLVRDWREDKNAMVDEVKTDSALWEQFGSISGDAREGDDSASSVAKSSPSSTWKRVLSLSRKQKEKEKDMERELLNALEKEKEKDAFREKERENQRLRREVDMLYQVDLESEIAALRKRILQVEDDESRARDEADRFEEVANHFEATASWAEAKVDRIAQFCRLLEDQMSVMECHVKLMATSNLRLSQQLGELADLASAPRCDEAMAKALEISVEMLTAQVRRLEQQDVIQLEERDGAVAGLEHALRRAALAEHALDTSRRRLRELEKELQNMETGQYHNSRQRSLAGDADKMQQESGALLKMQEDEIVSLKLEQRRLRATIAALNASLATYQAELHRITLLAPISTPKKLLLTHEKPQLSLLRDLNASASQGYRQGSDDHHDLKTQAGSGLDRKVADSSMELLEEQLCSLQEAMDRLSPRWARETQARLTKLAVRQEFDLSTEKAEKHDTSIWNTTLAVPLRQEDTGVADREILGVDFEEFDSVSNDTGNSTHGEDDIIGTLSLVGSRALDGLETQGRDSVMAIDGKVTPDLTLPDGENYVLVSVDGAWQRVGKTSGQMNSTKFFNFRCSETSVITVHVMSWSRLGGQHSIGIVRIPVPSVYNSQDTSQLSPVHKEWYALQSPKGLPIRNQLGVCALELLLLLRSHPSARRKASMARHTMLPSSYLQAHVPPIMGKDSLVDPSSSAQHLRFSKVGKHCSENAPAPALQLEEACDEELDLASARSSKPQTPDISSSPVQNFHSDDAGNADEGGIRGGKNIDGALTLADLHLAGL